MVEFTVAPCGDKRPSAQTNVAVILKTNDDCRQDQLALQLISLFGRIFRLACLPIRPTLYDIVTTSPGAGVIHVVPDAMSRDRIGRLTDGNLAEYLRLVHGPESTLAHRRARLTFARSLAAYSVISYILQVKDRHNGNLLVTDKFGLVHIDFGFLFDSSPGGNIKFERAAFKLTREYVEVLGDGAEWNYYESLVVRGFLAARDRRREIICMCCDTLAICLFYYYYHFFYFYLFISLLTSIRVHQYIF